ncbi:MAG TPA: anti-sigma factor [Deltaproteobacteria bacterium]|nr:anti-sigma factor [Deltaproteobacteria bacterium]
MLDREIAGIRCREVLDALESYLAGELDRTLRERIEAHLVECDRCARFGGIYAETCRDLRTLLAKPEPAPHALLERLKRRTTEGAI